MKTNFYFIRHGETANNLSGVWQGQHIDSDLTQNGKLQVRQVAEKLDSLMLEVLYTSHLNRAQKTASIISFRCDLPIKVSAAFAEINYGVAEGQKLDVLKQQYPKVIDLFYNPDSNQYDNHFPDGETVWDVLQRVFTKLDEIFEYQCQKGYQEWNIGIVSHAGVITSIMSALGVENPRVNNCDIVHISKDEAGYMYEEKL